MKDFYSQVDPKWQSESRYHQLASDSLQELDKSILDCLKDMDNNSLKVNAWESFGKFTGGIADLIENGMNREINTSGYSIYNYGCWDCTMSMIISHFGKSVYLSEKSKGLTPNPGNFVRALREWQILSPIGFAFDIINDPISTITKAKVQLCLHADYGEKGIAVKDAIVFNHALNLKEKVGIAVCVKGHPSFGNKDASHWVYIDPVSSTKNIIMGDPSERSPSKFTYRKIYEICVYTTPDEIHNVFNS